MLFEAELNALQGLGLRFPITRLVFLNFGEEKINLSIFSIF